MNRFIYGAKTKVSV